MRKSVFFILLATAAMPALAAGPNREDRGGDRAEARAERSERGGGESAQHSQRAERAAPAQNNGVQRIERAPRAERSQAAERSQVLVQSNQSNHQSSNGRSGRRNWTGSRSGDGVQSAPVVVRDSTETVTNWRARERRVATSQDSPTTSGSTTSHYSGRGDRSGTDWGVRSPVGQPSTTTTTRTWRDGNRDDHTRRWTSNWRNDHRYNWRYHRSHYSSLYRLGRYYDPFGYGYRRFSIGFSLRPSYYSSNYWLDDPWQYRLPPAYGPYRWIRYYDDALLVNIYSGEVVDVIHNFFW